MTLSKENICVAGLRTTSKQQYGDQERNDLLLCPLRFPQKVGTTLCVAVSTPLMVRVSFRQSPSEGWVNDVVRKSTLHTQTEADIETSFYAFG
jgi:hypothetical protein